MQDVAQLCVQDYGAAATPHLIAKLESSEAATLCALEALGAVGDECAFEPVARVALERDDSTDRWWAAEALVALARRHPERRNQAKDTLRAMAERDASPENRGYARELMDEMPP